MAMDPELDRFKKEIKLYEYMASKGYGVNNQKSSKRNIVMNGPGGDTVVTKQDMNGNWIYFDTDTEKGGSIIEFIQKQLGENKNLGEIRKELRSWIGIDSKPFTGTQFKKFENSKKSEIDQTPIVLKELKSFTQNNYLQSRFIEPETHQNFRFKDTIFEDSKKNIVFPHVTKDEKDGLKIIGLEKKNFEYKGFVEGGTKGLWVSNCFKGDDRLVVTESVIDALSYHKLHGDEKTRYAAISGNISKLQEDLIKRIAKTSKEKNIRLFVGTDNDKAGDKLFTKISSLAKSQGVEASRVKPKLKDWNKDLEEMIKMVKKKNKSAGLEMGL